VVAWKELGEQVYLDRAVGYAEYMLRDEYPIPNHAAAGLRALTLLETARASGEKRFAAFAAEKLAPMVMGKQALGTGDRRSRAPSAARTSRPSTTARRARTRSSSSTPA